MSSSSNSKGIEETHNSDTLADETGVGEHRISEVPSQQFETLHEEPKSRKWLPLTIVVGFLAVCAVIGIAVGLTRESDDNDDDVSSSRMSKGTWIPIGAGVVPELEVNQDNQEQSNEYTETPPFAFWNFDSDGTHLVVADFSPQDQTAQVKWYAFDNQTLEWEHQTTLPLGDGHPQSFPVVKVAHDTLVVADARSLDLHPDLDTFDVHKGLVTVYQLGQEQGQEPTLDMRFQASAGDMWGTSIEIDNSASTLAVGTPLATNMDTEARHAGVVHVYNLKALTLESIGRPLFGPHFLASLGSEGLALSGDGKVLAATTLGQVWIWRWNEFTNDWSEAVTLGPGVEHQVALNDDGSLLAYTTYKGVVVLYKYVCKSKWECGWDLQGTWRGSFVALLGDEKHMAIGHHENEDEIDMVQVYEYKDDEWFRMGSGIPGVAAVFMDDKHILVQQKESSAIQTWQWAALA